MQSKDSWLSSAQSVQLSTLRPKMHRLMHVQHVLHMRQCDCLIHTSCRHFGNGLYRKPHWDAWKDFRLPLHFDPIRAKRFIVQAFAKCFDICLARLGEHSRYWLAGTVQKHLLPRIAFLVTSCPDTGSIVPT